MSVNVREAILASARTMAQARGYGGLNFRDVADEVGIKAASIYYHFPSKAALGEAVARRYREDTASALEAIASDTPDPVECLRRYPTLFRRALARGNRMCLCSFMAAEHDDLPAPVRTEVRAFADVNVAWLAERLSAAGIVPAAEAEQRARAIFAAVAGAQLIARGRSEIALYDSLIDGYRNAGLLPA